MWSAIIKALEAPIDEAMRKETTGDCNRGGVAGDTDERSSAEEEGFEASGEEKWGLWINQLIVGNAGKYGVPLSVCGNLLDL